MLVTQVNAETAKRLDMMLMQKWEVVKGKIPNFLQETLSQRPSSEFLKESFYDVLRSFCSSNTNVYEFEQELQPRTAEEEKFVKLLTAEGLI